MITFRANFYHYVPMVSTTTGKDFKKLFCNRSSPYYIGCKALSLNVGYCDAPVVVNGNEVMFCCYGNVEFGTPVVVNGNEVFFWVRATAARGGRVELRCRIDRGHMEVHTIRQGVNYTEHSALSLLGDLKNTVETMEFVHPEFEDWGPVYSRPTVKENLETSFVSSQSNKESLKYADAMLLTRVWNPAFSNEVILADLRERGVYSYSLVTRDGLRQFADQQGNVLDMEQLLSQLHSGTPYFL